MTRRAAMGDTACMPHLTITELDSGLDHVVRSPQAQGTVELIVVRPGFGERRVLEEADLDVASGVVGDTWDVRPSRRIPDGSPHPDMQINIMNARCIALLAQEPERWPLAGDQLYVDLDLSAGSLPPGTRLALGSAVIEITAQPHRGCAKFADRFGRDALRWVNSVEGRELRLRGVNTRVVRSGRVRRGDRISKA